MKVECGNQRGGETKVKGEGCSIAMGKRGKGRVCGGGESKWKDYGRGRGRDK